MSYVVDEKSFGNAVAYLYVVEFHEHGLPHAHCLFFHDQQSRKYLKRPENKDELACVELPAVQHQQLQDVVMTHSTHTPLAPFNNRSSVFIKEGTYQDYFQKQFVMETGSIEGNYHVT